MKQNKKGISLHETNIFLICVKTWHNLKHFLVIIVIFLVAGKNMYRLRNPIFVIVKYQ